PRATGHRGHLECAEREPARCASGKPLGFAVRSRVNLSRFKTAGALVVALLAGPLVRAQSDAGASGRQAPAARAAEPPAAAIRDALGRDTPRGTLHGFIRAARGGNDEAAV